MTKWIAVDAMGGDVGIAVTIPACVSFIQQHHDVGVMLCGATDLIQQELRSHDIGANRIQVIDAPEVIAMDESPVAALRYKKKSSMRVAINLVQSGEAAACVSAGNTGALMAISKFVLNTTPGLSRPAITTRMPTTNGSVSHILDLGANVDSSAEQLAQFALLGSAVARCMSGIEAPRVGLLNVGEEEIKGSAVIKQASGLIAECENVNYIGFVEGNDWFSGKADVVVCDGFVGNIALKAVEGMAMLFSKSLLGSFKRNFYTQISGLLSKSVLNEFKNQVDPRNYNGALLAGLNGAIFKSHGSADAYSFEKALEQAHTSVRSHLLDTIATHFAESGIRE